MKKKIRETMIAISYKEHLNRILKIILSALMILALIVMKTNTEHSKTAAFIVWLIGTPIICLWDSFDAIRKFPKRCLEKNKLKNIIFSNTDLWFHILEIVLVVPMCYLCLERNILKMIIAIVMLAVSFIFVSKKISNIFKKRLVK